MTVFLAAIVTAVCLMVAGPHFNPIETSGAPAFIVAVWVEIEEPPGDLVLGLVHLASSGGVTTNAMTVVAPPSVAVIMFSNNILVPASELAICNLVCL